ncbi:MAG: DUF4835 family protein [Chitinophagaceae bacterium]|nr:DUF4835 family protein [Chitinophagaceae bacterium]
MIKRNWLLLFLLAITFHAQSQELEARLSIIASKVSSTTNPKVFKTLQTALSNFLNNRHWTNDVFKPNEKIQCNFLLTINQDLGDDVYQGTLTVQSARPVFNTSYNSPIVNFIDDNIVFKYIEYQPIEFNENRVQGNDPIKANLPAILAYYANMIIGLDYDSFASKGGEKYFQKAWNIVNNAPENKNITGWKSFESLRNRYWLAENLNSNRFVLFHNAIYAYYRTGLDIFYQNESAGRIGMLNSLDVLDAVNKENPNSMIMQFFFQGKSNELSNVFSKADAATKEKAKKLLKKLDVTHSQEYNSL